MNAAAIIKSAKREKLGYVMRTSINQENYNRFKKICEEVDLTPAEVVRELVNQYMASYETEKALADAASHSNLHGPFKSGKDLIEDALKS